VHREFVSRVASQTCVPEFEAGIAGDINALRGNVTTSYVFQRAAPPATPAAAASPATPVTPNAVTTVPLTPVSATTPVPAVAATTPAAPAPPKTIDFSRTVAADQKMRLAFLYDINPDCTSIGFATVRVVEQPKHGKITIENGTGFTAFPESNLRVECNKRRSDGVAVIYEPEPGYMGADSVNFDAIYASGSLSKRRYAIEVR
jgi:hypothetical protein